MTASSEQRPVGSATEEAARLVESLGGWFAAASATVTASGTAGPGAEPAAPEQTAPEQASTDRATTDRATPGQASYTQATPDQPPHDPTTCRHCPLCRGMQALRAVRPEVVEHLSAAAGSLAAALRELGAQAGAAAQPDRPAEPDAPPDARASADPAPTGGHADDTPGTHGRTTGRAREDEDGAPAWV